MNKQTLSERMKKYEGISKTSLSPKIPVIMRLDMKAGRTYTKGMDKPFDNGFIQDMNAAAIYVLENVQGGVCAFVQSDEISILFLDTQSYETQGWFDYQIQKMCSVGASMAATGFNKSYVEGIIGEDYGCTVNRELITKWANFDCRVFNLPESEVNNYFIWRQRDTVKNSISMVAQSEFSPKELHGKNGDQQQEMLITQKGINWNDLDCHLKRGRWITKQLVKNPMDKLILNSSYGVNGVLPERRKEWVLFTDTPDFSKNPELINKIVCKTNH